MKRIDVLKGIEQILVQKAYETGHISHRADGDWQKQADGSWLPMKGNGTSAPASKEIPTQQITDKYGHTEDDYNAIVDTMLNNVDISNMSNEEIGKLAEKLLKDVKDKQARSVGDESYEEDLKETDINQIDPSGYANNISIDNGVADNDDLEDVANQILLDNDLEVNDENMNKARNVMLSWLDENGYLDSDEDDDESYGDDEVDYTYAKDIDYSQYDDDIKSIEFRENDDGELEPHDDDYFRVADKIYEQTDREDMSDEEADQLYDEIVDRVIDRAYELRNGGEDNSSYSEYLSNQDAIESYVDELDFDPDSTLDQTNKEDVEAYLNDHDWDSNFQQYLKEQGFDTDSIDEDSDEYQNALNDFMNKAVTYLSDNWDYRTEADQQYEDYKDSYLDNVVNEYGNKTAEEALGSWIEDYGFEDLSDNNRKDFIEQFNKRIQKSAIRDMRSAPTTKNMGF